LLDFNYLIECDGTEIQKVKKIWEPSPLAKGEGAYGAFRNREQTLPDVVKQIM
jgi:hypothetical protein